MNVTINLIEGRTGEKSGDYAVVTDKGDVLGLIKNLEFSISSEVDLTEAKITFHGMAAKGLKAKGIFLLDQDLLRNACKLLEVHGILGGASEEVQQWWTDNK